MMALQAQKNRVILTRAMTRAMEMEKVENCEQVAEFLLLPENQVVMDDAIWSNLPEHVMEKFLAQLPLPTLFRFSLVCKSWNALKYTPVFLELHKKSPSQGPWFLLLRNQDYRETFTFNPMINRWLEMVPASFPLNQMFFPVTAAGGLVCFSSCANGRTTLVVCNPLTKQWRELPQMLKIQTYHMAGMAVDQNTHTYRIIVVGIYGIYDVYYPTTEVYDSATNGWHITGEVPRGPLFPSRRTLLFDGILYAWCCDPPDGLVAYDLQTEAWSQIHAPMRHSLESHTLIECQAQIYTVGGLRENSVTKSICVWELQKSELEWKEVHNCTYIKQKIGFRKNQTPCNSFLSSLPPITTHHFSTHLHASQSNLLMWKLFAD
jgi:hypothetical protein